MSRRGRREPVPLKDLVPAVLRGVRPKGALEKVRRVWPEVVGAAAAGRTRIRSLDGGRLSVEVASAALKHDLSTFRGEAVLKALRERVPEAAVREVVYRVGTPS